MSENTKIEWATHTFNPWIGCTKVSPGCANCYAEAHDHRFGGGHWGKGAPRKRTSEANWRKPLQWDRQEAAAMVSHEEFANPRRPRVFCASLADWLDDEVPIEWLADLLSLIHATPNLDWLLLTKRPENWRARLFVVREMASRDHNSMRHGKMWSWLNDWLARDHGQKLRVPHNIWIGTTLEDQQRADERIPHLLQIPAKVRFLSCEPLLGTVDLENIEFGNNTRQTCLTPTFMGNGLDAQIDWVICGGESGPNARPMHPDWARGLRDQCAATGTPFFFKQWGEWLPVCEDPLNWKSVPNGFDWHRGKESTVLQLDGRQVAEHPGSQMTMIRMGKKLAGRFLDGRELSGFPA